MLRSSRMPKAKDQDNEMGGLKDLGMQICNFLVILFITYAYGILY